MSARIRKGDTVEVLKGKHRGARGQVLRIDGESGRVLVQRVNLVKRHQKANAQNRQGGIIEKEAPLESNPASAYPTPSADAPACVARAVGIDAFVVHVLAAVS